MELASRSLSPFANAAASWLSAAASERDVGTVLMNGITNDSRLPIGVPWISATRTAWTQACR